MRLHLYWLDTRWQLQGKACADNHNLIIDLENKTYKVFVNSFYGYYRPEDIEVKKKSDIADCVAYLKNHGYVEWR